MPLFLYPTAYITNHFLPFPQATVEDPHPEPYIHESDESFLVWCFENYLPRWQYQAQCIKNNKGKEKTDAEYVNPEAKHETTGEYLEQKMKTPYSSSTTGQNKLGGVTDTGKQRLRELQGLVEENRTNRMDELDQIDDEVLKIVRKINRREAIDANARNRARRAANGDGGAVESDDGLDDSDIEGW